MLRRIAGRIGLDFVVSGIKFANRQIGMYDIREHASNISNGIIPSPISFVSCILRPILGWCSPWVQYVIYGIRYLS